MALLTSTSRKRMLTAMGAAQDRGITFSSKETDVATKPNFKADTSFNFGANTKPKAKTGKKAKSGKKGKGGRSFGS